MKTVKFTREANTVNEYTCDGYDDLSGEYVSAEQVLAFIDNKIKEIDEELNNYCISIRNQNLYAQKSVLNELKEQFK